MRVLVLNLAKATKNQTVQRPVSLAIDTVQQDPAGTGGETVPLLTAGQERRPSHLPEPSIGRVAVVSSQVEEHPPSLLTDEATSPGPATFIEDELKYLLDSKTFSRSPRLKRFVDYVVKQSLAGAPKLLKEYVIAQDVFDRNSSFDPSSDPIVRVEAARLRNRLQLYYTSEGAASKLRIDLPKGTYVARFRLLAAEPQREIPRADLNYKPIIVLPFTQFSDRADGHSFHTAAFSEHLIHLLTKSSETRVVSRLSSAHFNYAMDARELGQYFGIEFIVEGSITTLMDECHVLAYLVEAAHGYNVWSGSYKANPVALDRVADELATDLLHALPEPVGR